jgi:hypothetical protein
LGNEILESRIVNNISPNLANSSIAETNWAVKQFKQMPTYVCIPLLNKWKLENLKVGNIIIDKEK